MTFRISSIVLAASVLLFACNSAPEGDDSYGYHSTGATKKYDAIHYEQETHLSNIRQLTYGGNNAEAYWSFDDTKLVFQSDNSNWGNDCDHIYVMQVEGKKDSTSLRRLSSGGRTTCSFFMPGDSTILYGSTHLVHDACPPVPPRDSVYVWPIYEAYDIFVSDLDGNITQQLTHEPGYDAEAVVSPDGSTILYTSLTSGDLELWMMDIDGANKRQITSGLGYDGGAFFSPDGSKIVWRASRPQTEEEATKYKDLLLQGLVQPTDMELYVANADGSDQRQVTDLGGANWSPYFHPSGEKLLFCSNHQSEEGFPFNIYMVNLDGTNVEQITYDSMFDSFPMFSRDGKKLVWSSNRNNGRTRDTNVFIADWND
jgi:TolB protein